MNKKNFIAILLACPFSCKPKIAETRVVNTNQAIAPNIIDICIDSILVLDAKVNTQEYYLDLEDIRKTHPALVNTYLNQHPMKKVTNLDSLVKVKSGWLKNDFRNYDIIQFNSINQFSDSIIAVSMTKRRYIDASFGAEIVFKKEGGTFVCTKNEITWIN